MNRGQTNQNLSQDGVGKQEAQPKEVVLGGQLREDKKPAQEDNLVHTDKNIGSMASVAATNRLEDAQRSEELGSQHFTKEQQNHNFTDKQPLTFHSKEIGAKVTKRTDPFEEHKHQNVERKRQQKRQQQMVVIAAIVVAVIVALGAIVWFVLAKVVLESDQDDGGVTSVLMKDGSDEEIENLRDLANRAESGEDVGLKIADGDEELGVVETGDDVFVVAINQTENEELRNQVRLAEIYYQFDQNNYEEITEICSKIKAEALTLEQQQSFYNVCAAAYNQQEMSEVANEYSRKAVEVAQKLQEVNK